MPNPKTASTVPIESRFTASLKGEEPDSWQVISASTQEELQGHLRAAVKSNGRPHWGECGEACGQEPWSPYVYRQPKCPEVKSWEDRGVADAEGRVVEIRERYAKGEGSQAELAREYGLGKTTVRKIVTGESWQQVGGPRTRGLPMPRRERQVDPEACSKAEKYDELVTLGLLEQLGITE